MRRFLLPLLAAIALPTAVNAGVEPEVHNLCKDVADYMGCVKANSKKEGWNPFNKTAKEKKSNNFAITISDEFFDYNDIDRVNEWKNKKPEIREYTMKKGFGFSFFYSPLDRRIYVTQSIGPAKKKGIKIGDQLISAGKYNFLDTNLSFDVIQDVKERDKFEKYLAKNNSLGFKLKRGNNIKKYTLSHKTYTSNEIRQKEYYLAQSLRFFLTTYQGGRLEVDQNVLFPEILNEQTAEFKRAYLTQIKLAEIYKIDNSNKNTSNFLIKNPEIFTHKGESYTASKTCSDDKRFYWNIEKGFLKKEKVVEVGCLSDYELQSLKNQARNKSSGGSRWNGNNQAQQNRMIIQTNEYKRLLDSIKY